MAATTSAPATQSCGHFQRAGLRGLGQDQQELITAQPASQLRLHLKYGPNGERVIRHIRRISKPGRRVYVGVKEIPRVRRGLGIAILSTSKGVLTDREARKLGVGGELICEVW